MIKKSLLIPIFAFFLLVATPALAADYYVDPTGTDDGSHGTASGSNAWATIKYAVDNVANPTSDIITINVAAGTYNQNNVDLLINRSFTNLTIKGAGANSTFVQPATNLANSTSRVFHIGSSQTVTLEDMTIRYGKNEEGTAIYNSSSNSTLNLTNCRITDNHRASSSWHSDTAAIANKGNLNIENCTFDNNEGERISAIYVNTYNHPENFTTINNSTFYNNPTTYSGSSSGVIVLGLDAHIILTNSTIHQGSANGQGIYNINNDAYIYIKNTLITNPDLSYACAIDLTYGYHPNNRPEIIDGGYNIIESQASGAKYTFTDGVNGNIVGDQSSLNLATSVSNNGSNNNTPTLALLAGSVAINAGNNTVHGPTGHQVTPSSTDQRGFSRNSTIDIGAFEATSGDKTDPLISSSSLASDNSYLDVTFSEGVYNTSSGSGAIEASDFTITLNDADGVTAAAINSITTTSGTSLSGGETTVRFNLDLTGSSYGTESITITPVNRTSIYDTAGNPMSSNQTTGAKTLNGETFNYYVDPTGTDDGSHGTASETDAWATIAYAINNIPHPSTTTNIINLSADTYTLNNTRINISSSRTFSDLTIKGAGASSTIIQPHTNSSQSTTGLFHVYINNNVTFKDLTLRYGRGINGSAIESRGSSSNRNTVTIENCLIDDNKGPSYGPISFIDSNLIIKNSTISNNYSNNYAGAISTSGGYTVITNTTFYNNRANRYHGTMYLRSNEAILTNVTVSGGGASYGGAVYIQAGDLYLKNTLLTADIGRALDSYGSRGGRIYSNGYNIIQSRGSSARSSSYSTYQDTDIFWDTSQHRWEDKNNNEISGSLNMASTLADNNTLNGTQTLLLNNNSIAINKGNGTIHGPTGHKVTPTSTDQRGLSRIGAIDIGAYEYGATSDTTAPAISSVDNTPAETSATITWTTDEAGSSLIEYGVTSNYGRNSSETHTGSRVTSHSYNLTGLQKCRRYFYRVKSKDAANNQGVSSQNVLKTAGCLTSINSGTEKSITTVAGGEFQLTNNSSIAKLTVPDGFASQNADFQINRLATTGITAPSGTSLVDEDIFDFSALGANNTDVTSFDKAITFTLTYGANIESTFNESSLDVYRYNTTTGEWDDKNCTLDTSANTLTCHLSSFSTYAIFGQTASASSSSDQTNTSSNDSSSSDTTTTTTTSTTCTDKTPSHSPNLFKIKPSRNTATLYFSPVAGTTHYYLNYSTHRHAKGHGALASFKDRGVQSWTVTNLVPNQTYYFKIRGQNGCATGAWSPIALATTDSYWAPSKKIEILNIKTEELPFNPNACDYTVKSGDTLSSIAKEKLGDAQSYTLIKQLSGISSNALSIGQILRYPCQKTNEDSTQTKGLAPVEKEYHQPGITVDVKVHNKEGKPLAGVEVTMHSKVQIATTDNNGIAHFENVTPGNHRLILAYNGYHGEQELKLDGDKQQQIVTVQIQMNQKQLLPTWIWITITAILIIIIGSLILFVKTKKSQRLS